MEKDYKKLEYNLKLSYEEILDITSCLTFLLKRNYCGGNDKIKNNLIILRDKIKKQKENQVIKMWKKNGKNK